MTRAEKHDAILRAYRSGLPVDLPRLERETGMHRTNICRFARQRGLTDPHRKKAVDSAAIGARIKRLFREQGHPRGALGMKHTLTARAKIGAASRQRWADPRSAYNSPAYRQRMSDNSHARALASKRHPYSSAKRGRRADLGGQFFRSRWEANFARYLNLLVARGNVIAWDYEPHTFVFPVKRGVRSYTPDFRVVFAGGDGVVWCEVKGWWDAKSRARASAMRRFFSTEVVQVYGEKFFRACVSSGLAARIDGWEHDPHGH